MGTRRTRSPYLAGGRSLRSVCGGQQPPIAQAHRPGKQKVLPSWRSQPTQRLRGKVVPNGASSRAGGTEIPSEYVVPAYKAAAGNGSPEWRRPMGWADSEACTAGGCSLRSAYTGQQSPEGHGPTGFGDEESCPVSGGGLKGACEGEQSIGAGHRLKVQGVLPNRWLQPTEHLRGTAARNGAGSRARWTGCLAHSVIVA